MQFSFTALKATISGYSNKILDYDFNLMIDYALVEIYTVVIVWLRHALV